MDHQRPPRQGVGQFFQSVRTAARDRTTSGLGSLHHPKAPVARAELALAGGEEPLADWERELLADPAYDHLFEPAGGEEPLADWERELLADPAYDHVLDPAGGDEPLAEWER